MATPIYIYSGKAGTDFTINGTGLFATVLGTWVSDTGTGERVIKGTYTSGAAADIRAGKSVAGATCVHSFYVRFGSLPTGTVVVDLAGVANSPATGFASFGYNPVTGFFCARVGASGKQEDNVTVAINTWYRIDFKSVISGGNMVVDVKVDGRDITQVSVATSATLQTNAILGTVRTDHTWSGDVLFKNWVVSATAGDYPLSAGANYGVQLLKPSADGTHNAGTNVIEANDGTDIGTTTAYDKLNSTPISATTYIQQAATGTGNYAEVAFDDITDTHNGIIGAMAFLAYTSATTSANRGACIVSKDNFSTNTEVWGNPTTTADYSDGSTANLFYKSAIIAGATDDTTINALKARVGYSGDASPNPYWIDLVVEVAYTVAVGLTGTVNQVAESDTPQAIARQKIKAVGQAVESDLAQTITRGANQTIVDVLQVAETDTSQVVGVKKIRAVGQALETNTSQAVTHKKTKAIGQIESTESAQALTTKKIEAIGQATETNTALPNTEYKAKSIGQVIGLESIQAFGKNKSRLILQVTETNSAQTITNLTGTLINQVEETDIAQGLWPSKMLAIAQPVEIESVEIIAPAKIRIIGQVEEINQAQQITAAGPIVVVLGQVVEIDNAQPITQLSNIVVVELHLHSRGTNFTLPSRSIDFSLSARNTNFILHPRYVDLHLEES